MATRVTHGVGTANTTADSGRHERWPERTALRRTAAEERRWSESKQLSLPKPAPDSEGCAALAMKALEEGKPFDALISCERALRTCATSESLRCGMLSALALESLGLLNLAQERLGQAARMAKDVDLSTLQMALEAMKRVRGRERQIEEGDAQVLMEEIQRMGALLGDQEAGYWISCVGECSRSKEGQAELVQKGFLLEAHRNLQQPAQVARHASLVALRYRINKKLQRHLSAAGLLMGVADQCLLPKALHSPLSVDPLEEQLRQSLDELRAKRLVVLDEVLPPEALCKVKLELQRMRQEQVLQNDTNDVCNPLQEAKYLPFADDATQFRESCPVTMQVMQRLAALASILEEELGLQLAVPKSAMAACYPPKASYKMHLDSYFLHGCPDDIPRKVTILLYCNQGWTKSVGGELRAWEAFDQGRGPSRTIEPLTGRMVVFMAEEIWHEVLESHGDRYALTLWIHDRARVQISP
ncbi:Egl nine homolog 1 (Hypoxia-inducible factor prolyl hydroxylase 2) (HIF-PH2) (HIF-prolyl hydroxylase 2) (HPH-2) (Prolyl hydroxylase domain-containing protein 2) (PHD2) (SM-20) [Durusdinium trenchii]|uniref:Egl nine homolog 1 (Hypoxia-inducible factor prolyl hydroxylase 2) (HIF-PH2) (HIF-prolyl hydroxylase 2) (HPH-2) (Prolyl hydroxylase domain-containing protein 2) (PHD2) (SM-20) n=1 Tax=Durusdinium trenchii TaxID=1381693 RepID=A0ABP0RYN1_9DINO